MRNQVARANRVRIVKTDWFRILLDMQAAGITMAYIARALSLADSTVRNWKYGNEPLHSKGEALLVMHRRRVQIAEDIRKEREAGEFAQLERVSTARRRGRASARKVRISAERPFWIGGKRASAKKQQAEVSA